MFWWQFSQTLHKKFSKLQKPNDSHSTGYKEDPDEDFEITVKTD